MNDTITLTISKPDAHLLVNGLRLRMQELGRMADDYALAGLNAEATCHRELIDRYAALAGQAEAQLKRKDLLVRFREYLTESHGEPPTLDDDWEYEHGLIAEIDRVLER